MAKFIIPIENLPYRPKMPDPKNRYSDFAPIPVSSPDPVKMLEAMLLKANPGAMISFPHKTSTVDFAGQERDEGRWGRLKPPPDILISQWPAPKTMIIERAGTLSVSTDDLAGIDGLRLTPTHFARWRHDCYLIRHDNTGITIADAATADNPIDVKFQKWAYGSDDMMSQVVIRRRQR